MNTSLRYIKSLDKEGHQSIQYYMNSITIPIYILNEVFEGKYKIKSAKINKIDSYSRMVFDYSSHVIHIPINTNKDSFLKMENESFKVKDGCAYEIGESFQYINLGQSICYFLIIELK